MKKSIKGTENPLQDEISADKTTTSIKPLHSDEGEHFEIDIMKLIRVRSRRVTVKVIIVIMLMLIFVWLLVKW